MLNIFSATCYVHYAKSAVFSSQQMMELERYNFIENDYHTIRRTNIFWAGLWSDVIIEQVMMRSLKIRGGITRRHGVIESVEVLRTYTAQ